MSFILKRTYTQGKSLSDNVGYIEKAFSYTVKDVNYHFPYISAIDTFNRIITNQNELLVCLYRIGNFVLKTNADKLLLQELHWLMKDLCCSEVYFSTNIGQGFYPFHGEGLVIGSRNDIGKGLRIYQNVTIGQKFAYTKGG